MTDSVEPTYYYPNNMGRIILLSMEEILGHNGLKAVLNQSNLSHLINNYPPNNLDLQFKFENLSKIQVALEELYGPNGGRGLALRTGRACFKYGLQEYGPILGLTDLAFRLLPMNEKLVAGGEIFAGCYNKFSDQRVRVDQDEGYYYWIIERCPTCWGRHTDEPACHLAVGILEEALFWVSSGKHYRVEETECIAKGDATCTIKIDKQPIE